MTNIIWCTYHDKKLIKEYDLKETDNFKLFYTKDEELAGNSINSLQDYLCEWVTQYYVWKNELKSDIVTFCHYRRIISNDMIDFNQIKRKGYQTYNIANAPGNLYNHYNNLGISYLMNCSFLTFVKVRYPELFANYVKYLYSSSSTISYNELFSCTWEVFDKLCFFVEDYLKFLFKTDKDLNDIPRNNVDIFKAVITDINCNEFLQFRNFHKGKNLMEHFELPFFGYPRNLAFQIEHIIGMYFSYFINKI